MEASWLHALGSNGSARAAERQDGVIGIDQLPALGGDHREHWTAGPAQRPLGTDERQRPPARRVAGVTDPEQRSCAGVLDAGQTAILHGESALAWFGLRNRRLEPVQIGRRRGTSNRHGALAIAHRMRDVRVHDIVVVHGLPVLSPVRAVWTEAERLSSLPLEWALPRIARPLDDLHRAGLIRWEELHASVDALGRRGRRGTTIMRLLADERQPGTARPRAASRIASPRCSRKRVRPR